MRHNRYKVWILAHGCVPPGLTGAALTRRRGGHGGADGAVAGLGRHDRAAQWLRIWSDLGRAPRTIDAYARGLAEYLEVCEREGVDPSPPTGHMLRCSSASSRRAQPAGRNVVSIDSGVGVGERHAPAAARAGPAVLRLPDRGGAAGVQPGRPRAVHTRPGDRRAAHEAWCPRLTRLPWIPNEQQWLEILPVASEEPIRNRVMLALAYDAALRREELCSLRTDDLDPAHRTLRVRAETTKNRRERVVPYSAATGVLLSGYLTHRAGHQPGPRPVVLVRVAAQPCASR